MLSFNWIYHNLYRQYIKSNGQIKINSLKFVKIYLKFKNLLKNVYYEIKVTYLEIFFLKILKTWTQSQTSNKIRISIFKQWYILVLFAFENENVYQHIYVDKMEVFIGSKISVIGTFVFYYECKNQLLILS